MSEYFGAVAAAFWLGILTAISPCPLATNITAISYVGRELSSPGKVLQAGILYTLGRMLAYVVIGILLTESLLSAPLAAQFLQKYMNLALGPVLILVGLVLFGVISFSLPESGFGERLQAGIRGKGVWGGGVLGVFLALTFCPTSAALFFGSLLPLALQFDSPLVLPSVYGVATGLPVLIFALLLVFGASRLASAYNQVARFEQWARKVTALLFILVGIYYSLTNIFGLEF
jgi:cytochrome c biogenesis protein CcdA